MKRFLRNTVHFSCYLIAANLLLYLANKTVYYDEYTAFEPNYPTYLLADSHGHSLDTLTQQYGIFNFSDPSDSYEDMLRKVKYLIAHSEVKKIIISSDDHTLTTYREDNNNLDRSAVYATSEDYDSFYEQFSEQYLKRYIPLLHGKSRDALVMHIKYVWSDVIKNRILWANTTQDYRNSKALQRSKVHYENSERSEKLEATLMEIIDLCISNDIEIQGVKFPVTDEYYRATEGLGFDTEAVFLKHGLTVLDFTTVFSSKTHYFRDQDHINTQGARALSPLLNQLPK